jgi:hypothetical protein
MGALKERVDSQHDGGLIAVSAGSGNPGWACADPLNATGAGADSSRGRC